MNFIIFDLEWNQKPKSKLFEIIEIGAVKINNGKTKGYFHSYVKPLYQNKLSQRVQKITGIQNRDIRQARSFKIVINSFQKWIGKDYILCSWGTSDLVVLKQNCELYNIPTFWITKSIDIQEQFDILNQTPNNKKTGLKTIINTLGLSATIKEHKALSDAIDTSKIFFNIFTLLDFEDREHLFRYKIL